jgi:hypothetical protein
VSAQSHAERLTETSRDAEAGAGLIETEPQRRHDSFRRPWIWRIGVSAAVGVSPALVASRVRQTFIDADNAPASHDLATATGHIGQFLKGESDRFVEERLI